MKPVRPVRRHWDAVYTDKATDAVSWYAPHLDASLHYIAQAAPDKGQAILDAGGGASTLVDDLVRAGHTDITVLDISAKALDDARRRLGPAGARVKWLAADILAAELPQAAYDVWHDRAVFHFFTSDAQRSRYVSQVLRALKPGGHAIVGTFGPEGPRQCSGLDVVRYAPEALHDTFGERFGLLDARTERHTTPWGSSQQFVYCFCRRSLS